ncbi:hydrolase [Asticcacaulis sp. ZE23SCel15]|uniref:hydrolase n=1 Tax=Asticcacaulis sp. ZE23SCel15 TaxID=3059027 RepID=UPI002660157C|nr:hydrolase [Asticcacaulis sp. ZE23SCel15]WKL57048.1 hydrolase [Asticcacaulis sp. ZE23SCel15]
MIALNPRTTALVLIDLQNGIINRPLEPRDGQVVAEAGMALAERFRAAKALVVPVHVCWAKDYADMPSMNVDQPMPRPEGGMPADFATFHPGLVRDGDLIISKHQWGALYGTELDAQLRRRGVKTIVLGGIATNFGVESTARQGWEHGYDVVICEDLCTSQSDHLHRLSVQHILPRISRVIQSAELHFTA